MGTPTSFPGGVGTTDTGTFKKAMFPSPTDTYSIIEDFIRYTAALFTVTETDAGATQALTNGPGGLLLLTNTAADNDAISMQMVGEAFRLVAGKRMWFECRFKVSDATQSDVLFGLVITDTSPLTHTDGIVFRKDDGDTNIDFASVKDSAGTTSDAVGTLADDTFTTLGMYFDGTDIFLFQDGVQIKVLRAITFSDDEDLTPTIHLQNGEAVAKTMTVDYIMAAIER